MRVKDIETKLKKAIALGHLYFEQKCVAHEIENIHGKTKDAWLSQRCGAEVQISPHAIIEYLTQNEKGNALTDRQVSLLQRMIEKAFEHEKTVQLNRVSEFNGGYIQYNSPNFFQWGIISKCNKDESKKEILFYDIEVRSWFERALFEVFGKPKINVLRDIIICKKMREESLQSFADYQRQTGSNLLTLIQDFFSK